MVRPKRPNRSKSLRKSQSVRRKSRVSSAQHKDTAGSDAVRRYHFGAVMQASGQVRFRVWVPGELQVVLDIPEQGRYIMERGPDGVHELTLACDAGTRYCYRLADGRRFPDPASRRQDGDAHGFSCVVDPDAYTWTHSAWRGRPWHETVLYEVHAGLAGGFDGVRRKLPELAQLGFTAIELMPVADFPGARNWGYDGVLPYAPDESYGTPDQLRQLIDAAHGLGMQVFLDVVYNHFGPEGNYLPDCVPEFFRHDKNTPWGAAIDFRRPEVRAFFTENALYWLRDYCFDGLRLDAVHAIDNTDWLVELARAVHQMFDGHRHVHLVLENDNNDARLLEEGFQAQWNDDAHHVVHHMLTGETDGYYAAYCRQPVQKLCRALSEGFVYQGEPSVTRNGRARGTVSRHLPPTSFVFFLQNHDQVGNRARGERLHALCAERPDALRAAVALQLLTPHIPLVFMGDERGSRRPFLYFTDFSDAGLIESIREGRRREFGQFSGYSDVSGDPLPDPEDERAWLDSCLYDDPVDEQVYQFYAELLRVRRQFVSPYLAGVRTGQSDVLDERAVVVRWHLDNGAMLTIYCNLSPSDCVLGPDMVGVGEHCIFTSRPQADYHLHAGRLPAETTVVTMRPYSPCSQHDAPPQEA